MQQNWSARMALRLVVFRATAIVGAVFACLLLADDLRRAPAFCPFSNGCAEVTSSQFGKLLGVPVSALGVVAFVAFFALTVPPTGIARRLIVPAALTAGVLGLALAILQFLVLHRLCRFCLVADGCGMLLAAAALGLPELADPRRESGRAHAAWAFLALAAVVAPPVWSLSRPPPVVPTEVRAVWLDGKINVVEITDFTCPFCRHTHDSLLALQSQRHDELQVVRFVAPGASHADGLAAARAYQCALRQGRGEPLAELLYAARSFTREELRESAGRAGLDLARFDADWDDAALDGELAAVRRWVDAQELDGLPQVWVQDILLFGEQSPESLDVAVRRVRAK